MKKKKCMLCILGVSVIFIVMIMLLIIKLKQPVKIDTNTLKDPNKPKIVLESSKKNNTSNTIKKTKTPEINKVKQYNGDTIVLTNNKTINTKNKAFFGDTDIKPNDEINTGKLSNGEEYILIYSGVKKNKKTRKDINEPFYAYTAKVVTVTNNSLTIDDNTNIEVDINCTVQKISDNKITEYQKSSNILEDHIVEMMVYKNKIINIVIYD